MFRLFAKMKKSPSSRINGTPGQSKDFVCHAFYSPQRHCASR
jgi:hypothetical protein